MIHPRRLAVSGSLLTAIGAACGVLSFAVVVMVRSCASALIAPVVRASELVDPSASVRAAIYARCVEQIREYRRSSS